MVALSSALVQFYSSRGIANTIWVEGDSYVSGATAGPTTAGLQYSLRNAGYVVINSAAGGSSITDIRDRLITYAEQIKQCSMLVVWDGSPNGFVDADSYTDLLEAGLNGITNFTVIPAGVPYGIVDPVQGPAILAEFLARWPTKTLDWRGWIANTDGIIDLDRMLDYPTDTVHLNELAYDECTDGIETML